MAIDSSRLLRVTNESNRSIICGQYRFFPGATLDVPLDFTGQFGFVKGLKFDYTNFSENFAHHTEEGVPVFDFWCPLSSVDGYGRHALDIYRGLRKLGYDVHLRNSGYFVDMNFLGGEVLAEADASKLKMPAKVALAMTVPYDPMLFDSQSIFKVGITQFETDNIPEKHIDRVNRLDHLIVTSSFQPPIWKKCGAKVPISVLTPGVNTDFFRYEDRPMDGKFKVLLLGALTGRKNPLGAIRIFLEASEGNPDWQLTIKTRPTPIGFKEVQAMVNALHARGDKRVKIIMDETHPNGVKWFYQHHDALLWPSKGEGVGLPPLEAMATGMEVVAACHSGLADFISDEVAWPIKTAGTEPADLPGSGFGQDYVQSYGSVGNWWIPDEKDAVKQLRRCFSSWLEGKGKGKRAAAYVSEFHSLAVQAESIYKVVERYL